MKHAVLAVLITVGLAGACLNSWWLRSRTAVKVSVKEEIRPLTIRKECVWWRVHDAIYGDSNYYCVSLKDDSIVGTVRIKVPGFVWEVYDGMVPCEDGKFLTRPAAMRCIENKYSVMNPGMPSEDEEGR